MTEKKLRFRAKIQGKEAGVVAAIIPPVDVREYFGTRGRVPIRGTINGFAFRSSLMPCGGPHMMPVNKALCKGAGAQPGIWWKLRWSAMSRSGPSSPCRAEEGIGEEQEGAGAMGEVGVHS